MWWGVGYPRPGQGWVEVGWGPREVAPGEGLPVRGRSNLPGRWAADGWRCVLGCGEAGGPLLGAGKVWGV